METFRSRSETCASEGLPEQAAAREEKEEAEEEVHYDDVLKALEAVEDFPVSRRQNVKKPGDTREVFGMCLGITTSWRRGPIVSRATRDFEELTRLLAAFGRQELPSDATFTSIQVNKDYGAALHVDGNNRGPSWIIGLGDYSGGQLWLHPHEASRAGRCVDLKGRWFTFDGRRPHRVLPFEGRRYTLVYFTYRHPKVPRLNAWATQRVSSLGFPLPAAAEQAIAPPPLPDKDFLLARAQVAYRCFCRRAEARGGPCRVVVWVDGGGDREDGSDDGEMRRRKRFKASLDPDAPLRHLAEAQCVLTLVGLPVAASDDAATTVQLALADNPLLPGDTPRAVGLKDNATITVRLPSEAAVASRPPADEPAACQPHAGDDADSSAAAVAKQEVAAVELRPGSSHSSSAAGVQPPCEEGIAAAPACDVAGKAPSVSCVATGAAATSDKAAADEAGCADGPPTAEEEEGVAGTSLKVVQLERLCAAQEVVGGA
eukprot:TRINITY_DN19445_c0_g1_i2.p1 TRINITY_DN19445_c0_g1~~TRINITY_DN19445_c0_g1_i2.p1  ORF type:complete len:487 (-),score=130.97 TRINITY_DN19445_c0_g1_i2:376-1836(-)